jgi:hypothetical protein
MAHASIKHPIHTYICHSDNTYGNPRNLKIPSPFFPFCHQLSQGSVYVFIFGFFWERTCMHGVLDFLGSQCVPQHVPNSSSLYPISFGLSFTLVTYITSPKKIITGLFKSFFSFFFVMSQSKILISKKRKKNLQWYSQLINMSQNKVNHKVRKTKHQEFGHTQGEIFIKTCKRVHYHSMGVRLKKPSILVVNWVLSCLSFCLSDSIVATYIFTTPTCTTTIITFKPCALDAKFQHFILRFNKISLLCRYHWKRGLWVKGGSKTNDFASNSNRLLWLQFDNNLIKTGLIVFGE